MEFKSNRRHCAGGRMSFATEQVQLSSNREIYEFFVDPEPRLAIVPGGVDDGNWLVLNIAAQPASTITALHLLLDGMADDLESV